MKDEVIKILQKALKKIKAELKPEQIEKLIEIPPNSDMGDFAFPCFSLAGKLKSSPQEIATNLREEIGNPPSEFEDVQSNGPYINFFIDRKSLAINLINEILEEKENYGRTLSPKKPITTMIESPSPNTNKPLHIGHLRNMSIGESVSRISEFNGEKIIRANMNSDRGIHICKSMAAYLKYGKNSKPDKKIKPDHFVGKYYVLFGQKEKTDEELELLSHRLLQKWEDGDRETLELWGKMNNWAFAGFNETYKKFGVKFDKEYFESQIYSEGKAMVLDGLKKGIFEKRKDGAVIIDLKKEGLDEKVLLRIDGTSVYITADLYLAKIKQKEFSPDKSYYITGNEQDYHFQVLFSILKKLGFNQNLKHLSYGMVQLPEGKIKSREGTKGLTADEIIENTQSLVKKELNKRDKLSKKELEERSLKISLAAIKYALLKVDLKKNMIFNPKESISIEGDTGPYIQYSYARASSILKKIKNKKSSEIKIVELNKHETELIKKLSEFKEIVSKSYENLNPSLIANYSYQLAQIFNEFYHDSHVIGSEQEIFRINLVDAFRKAIKNSLFLLGIDVLEKM